MRDGCLLKFLCYENYHRGTGNLILHFDVFELTSAFHNIQ